MRERLASDAAELRRRSTFRSRRLPSSINTNKCNDSPPLRGLDLLDDQSDVSLEDAAACGSKCGSVSVSQGPKLHSSHRSEKRASFDIRKGIEAATRDMNKENERQKLVEHTKKKILELRQVLR